MRGKIIARADYKVYFIEVGKKRPGRNELREALRARHPFYANDIAMSREVRVIAGKRFEMVTIFAEPLSIEERIFGPRRRTQTQALVARFAQESPCVIRAPDELLFLEERPESIRRSGHLDEPSEAVWPDHDITEIVDDANALSVVLARGKPMLAIAAFLPVVFAIACATFNHGRSRTPPDTPQSVSMPVHHPHDFFTCLKEDIDAVNASGGAIVSYRYDGLARTRVSMKISGGKIAKLGEILTKAASISDFSIPAISFDKGISQYTVCSARDDGLEKKAAKLDWSKEQDLEAACAKAGIKIERITLSPFAECSFSMEMKTLSRFISLLGEFCDRASLDVKTCSLDSGRTCSIAVSFADKDEKRETDGPDADSIRRAFRQAEAHAEKKETELRPVVGKISEGGKRTVTFTKNETGKISNEGGFE